MRGNRRSLHPTKISFLFGGMSILFSIFNCIPFEPEGFLHVTTDSVLANYDDSYSLNGTIVNIGMETITDHGFCWSELSQPTVSDPSSRLGPKNSTGSFSTSITGLGQGITYNFRAFAVQESDTVYGEVKSIRTGNNGLPVADFIADKTAITEGESIAFTDKSANNPESWSWAFGDGNTSTQQNPTHIYNTAGTYTVSLTVSNSKGSDTETKSGYITVAVKGTAPVAAFTANKTTISQGESVIFTDQSVNNPESWSWTFGDGNTSTEQNPTHTYNSTGTFTVSLAVTNSKGSDTETKTDFITVKVAGLAPVAEFMANKTSVVVGEEVFFSDQSANDPTSWIWTFGDGDTAIAQHPTHSYTSSGTYTVSLTATNDKGSHTETKTGYISVTVATNPPVAAFVANKTSVIVGESIAFTDQSTNNPISWSWSFGDGNTSVLQHPTHSYSTSGSYSVSLTVTNSAGNDSHSKTNYITVTTAGSAPVAGFTANRTTITEGESVIFTDQSLNNPTSWSWNFGDGGTSTDRNPTYIYNTLGTYTVSLTATNSHGSNSETKTDYIAVTGANQGTVSDKSGNTYNTVKIGTQWWMAENLKATHYNNGNPIPQETGTTQWANLTTPAYCWFENDQSTYGSQYGALYNNYTVQTGNLCPTGWHVPSDEEWKTLEITIGMTSTEADGKDWRGTDEGTKLKATYSWDSGGNGTDDYGFKGLAGGYRSASGSYSGLGLGLLMWSTTEIPDTRVYYRTLGNNQSGIERWYLSKNCGFVVRCVKN